LKIHPASTVKSASAPIDSPQLIPPEAFMKIVGSAGVDSFIATGENFLNIFRNHGRLQPSDRVLDVGCGCGRMARPLTGYLKTGSYEGFDIIPELVAWCQENITPRHPQFRFTRVDVANAFYYGKGAGRSTQFRFPYEDGAFDFTILASVFTHMLMDDFSQYAAEVARTLRPGGTVLMTFFLLNPESRRKLETPSSRLRFRYIRGRGLRVEDGTRPEGAVAYPEHAVRSILRARGLEVQQILFGAWHGMEGAVSWQDIVIARRMSGPDPRPSARSRLKRIALQANDLLRRPF
jgi:SAM-dependent methyltransferase